MLEWVAVAWISSIILVAIVTYAMHRDGDKLFNDPQRPLEDLVLYGLVLSLAPLFLLFVIGFGVVEKFKSSSWPRRKKRMADGGVIDLPHLGDAPMEWPPSRWLERRLSVDELDTFESPHPPAQVRAILSFRDSWTRQAVHELAESMAPGDELWAFSSPPETWRNLMGRAGIVLVRRGNP